MRRPPSPLIFWPLVHGDDLDEAVESLITGRVDEVISDREVALAVNEVDVGPSLSIEAALPGQVDSGFRFDPEGVRDWEFGTLTVFY